MAGVGLLLRASREAPHAPPTAAVPGVEASEAGPSRASPSAPGVVSSQPKPTPEPALPAIDPDRRAIAQPNGPYAPDAMPETIAYPREAKLADAPLSAIPYRVVGAWDDAPHSPALGARRAFILVVDPSLSDGELADLARDVRDSHRDADWLTVRIFDSEAAATRPSWTDGGASRDAHMLAELRRNTAGPGEWLEVRGRKVDL